MLKDRLAYTTTILPNGHFLHCHEHSVPIVEFHFVTGIGNAHSHPTNGASDFGWVHFLEHMCFERSTHYLEKDHYHNLLQEAGAYQNATTNDTYTDYYLTAPASTFTNIITPFLDHITSPIFSIDDIFRQRSIITNELLQQKFFPGYDSLSHHVLTGWMDATYYPREQLFGSKESLARITASALTTLHKYYFHQPLHIFVGGNFDKEALIQTLNSLPPVKPIDVVLTSLIQPISWKQRIFHEFTCSDIEAPVLFFGNFTDHWTLSDIWTVSFILDLLTDSDHGVLQKWLRHKEGWSYGVEHTLTFDATRLIWQIKIPLSDTSMIDTIRREIHARIAVAISDEVLVAQTKQQLALQQCFAFETLSQRLELAIHLFYSTGQTPTEEEYLTWLQAVTPTELETIYKKLFTPEVIGEMLAIPVV